MALGHLFTIEMRHSCEAGFRGAVQLGRIVSANAGSSSMVQPFRTGSRHMKWSPITCRDTSGLTFLARQP